MSIAAQPTFGSGGSEPYAQALRDDGQELYLTESGGSGLSARSVMDVARWNTAADSVDLSLLDGHSGSVIDIGCGPGRMVAAAGLLGHSALGIDVSEAAVAIARKNNLPVIHRSVFDELPSEGYWDLALLVDGNIGIGGDVPVLLARTAEIVRTGGSVIAELHTDPARDRQFHGTLDDIHGHQSESFPWAEVGRDSLVRKARHLGLSPAQSWETGGRSFARLIRTR